MPQTHGPGGGIAPLTKTATIARTDTVAKNLFMLPKGAVPIGLQVIIPTASDAGTSATVSVGKTGSNTFFLNVFSVKTNSGQQQPTTAANLAASVGAQDIQVVGIYAESGSPSTTGGPFTFVMTYLPPAT